MSTAPTLAGDVRPLDAYRTTGPSPTAPTLHLLGAGRVGCALLRLLTPADGRLVAVSDSSATLHDPAGLDPRSVARWKEERGTLSGHPLALLPPGGEALDRVSADLVVDATATDLHRPEWAAALERARARGAAVALAAKDPAARLGFDWLTPGRGPGCGVNGALGGAGAGIGEELARLRREAVAFAVAGSASTTAVVSVLEAGGTLEEGLAAARARGLLEADPELDLRGRDAAVKAALVARILWNAGVDPEGVPCQDLRDVDLGEVRARARRGATTRLVARALRSGGCRVAYEEVPRGSPLAIPPDRVAYAFELQGGGVVVHLGAGLGPEETARAVLADAQALAGVRPGARRSGRVEGTWSTGVAHLPAGFRLEEGTLLHPAHVAFECRGPDDGPVVLALGGISAHRHVADQGEEARGWWAAQVGPGRALDTLRYRVLAVDWLGGSGGSSGPVSSPHWPAGAAVRPVDQARAVLAVLDELGIERLHLAAGASYGGSVVLELARLAPDRVRRICVLGAAHRPHPQATALRSLQRRIVRLGQETGRDADALALARGLGMVSYRSAAELEERFTGPPVGDAPPRRPVEGYLEHKGRDFALRFDPRAFLCLSESLDLQELDPAEVRTPALFVAFEPDALVPRHWVEETARRLGAPGRAVTVPTRYGHDGFLKEHGAVGALLSEALGGEVVR